MNSQYSYNPRDFTTGWLKRKETESWIDFILTDVNNTKEYKDSLKQIILNKTNHTETITIETQLNKNTNKKSIYFIAYKIGSEMMFIINGNIKNCDGHSLSSDLNKIKQTKYIYFDPRDYHKRMVGIEDNRLAPYLSSVAPLGDVLVNMLKKNIINYDDEIFKNQGDFTEKLKIVTGIYGTKNIFVLKLFEDDSLGPKNPSKWDYLVTPFGNIKIPSINDFNLKNSNKTLNDFLCDLFNLSQKDISNKNSIYNKVAEKIISPIDIDR